MSFENETKVDGLATIKEAELFLRVGKSSLYKLMENNQLPYVQIAGLRARRIPWKALKHLAEISTIGSLEEVVAKSGISLYVDKGDAK